MEQRYIIRLAEAYQKGYKLRTGSDDAPKLHYFKTKEDLPRVQQVLGFLWGVIPSGQVKTLLDVGSGNMSAAHSFRQKPPRQETGLTVPSCPTE